MSGGEFIFMSCADNHLLTALLCSSGFQPFQPCHMNSGTFIDDTRHVFISTDFKLDIN